MRTLGVVCALSLMAGNALAVPVTWVANGTIVGVSGSTELPVTAQLGDAFSYAVTFDNETQDVAPSPYYGAFPGAIQSVVFSVGGQDYLVPFDPAYSLAYSYNDFGQDYYQLSFSTSSEPPGDYYPRLSSSFGIWSTSPLALDTDQFPDAPPSDLSLYQRAVSLTVHESSSSILWSLQGFVTSIEQRPANVPEPSTALIFAAGLLATGLARRKRQS